MRLEEKYLPLAVEIPVDTGTSNVVPTITIEDTSRASPNGVVGHPGENADKEPEVPGAMPSQPASAIPEWYKIGWREVSGIDVQHPPEGEEKDRFVLQAFISEQYYGEWYHNAAIIVVVSSSVSLVDLLFTEGFSPS